MPIQLTTPMQFAPGRGAPVEVYEQAKIVGFDGIIEPVEDASMTLRVMYGNTVDGSWVSGQLPEEHVLVQDVTEILDTEGEVLREADPQYSDWVSSAYPTSVENPLYVEIALAFYTYLLTQAGFEGSIV